MDRKSLINKLIYYPELTSDYKLLLKKRQEIINKKHLYEEKELHNINKEIELHEEKELLINMIKSPTLSPQLSPSLRRSYDNSSLSLSSLSSSTASSPECISPLSKSKNPYF